MNKFAISPIITALLLCGCSLKSGSNEKMPVNDSADSITMFLCSYSPSGEEGIKVYKFNQADAGVSYVSGLSGISNPSFISEVFNDSLIYSVSEDGVATSSACALKFDSKRGRLSILNSQPTNGADPCNIAVCAGRKKVFTANYSGGNLSVFNIDDNGRLMADKVIAFAGSGPDNERQGQPHIHSVNFTPDGTRLWANDLGSDKIRVIDLETMSHDEKDDINLPSGCGPRHTCFHPDGKYAYVITELGGDILVLDLKDMDNVALIQAIKADTVGARGSADIHLSPDGGFLYASCRLKSDGIAIFSVDAQSGKLTRVGYCLTGKHPRNFAITPNGKYVLVACRDENAVEIYSRNPETGLLEDTGKRIGMKSPVCVRFIR